MRLLGLIFIVLFASETRQSSLQIGYGNQDACIGDQHAVDKFLTAFNAFTIDLYKIAANRGNNFFVLSPQATWMTLAAIAEGSDYKTQQELFQVLNLPQNACTRQKFYQITTSRTSSNQYVNIFNTRTLVIDQHAQINPNWYNLVNRNSLVRIIPAPIKDDPVKTFNMIQKCIQLEDQELNFNGNSVLMNKIDYTGLWTTAFDDAKIERAPFFSRDGRRLGSVDLMKTKRRVRIGYVASLDAKILELPIGSHGEYRMIFALSENSNPNVEPAVARLNNRTLFDVVASLQDSYVPIDIAIPRVVINSELNLKELLEDLGVVNLWKDPQGTRYISTPSAHPSSYIQKATLTLDSPGIYPATFDYGSVPHFTNELSNFVADRPFMFGLFDAETYTCLIGAFFSRPTYPY